MIARTAVEGWWGGRLGWVSEGASARGSGGGTSGDGPCATLFM